MKTGIKKRGIKKQDKKRNPDSNDFLAILPKKPGVYLFKNSKSSSLYIFFIYTSLSMIFGKKHILSVTMSFSG